MFSPTGFCMTNAYGRTFLPFGPWVNDRNCRHPAGWSRGTNCQMPQLVPNRGCSPIRTLQLLVELFQVLVPERNARRHGACLEFTKPPYFTSSYPESWTWPVARMPDPARARERNCHPSLMATEVAETTGAPYLRLRHRSSERESIGIPLAAAGIAQAVPTASSAPASCQMKG